MGILIQSYATSNWLNPFPCSYETSLRNSGLLGDLRICLVSYNGRVQYWGCLILGVLNIRGMGLLFELAMTMLFLLLVYLYWTTTVTMTILHVTMIHVLLSCSFLHVLVIIYYSWPGCSVSCMCLSWVNPHGKCIFFMLSANGWFSLHASKKKICTPWTLN